MNTGFLKKFIFYFFLLLNFILKSEASEFFKIRDKKYVAEDKFVWSNLYYKNEKNAKYQITKPLSQFGDIKKLRNNIDKDFYSLSTNFSKNKEELVVESEIQSEENNILVAEGNVSVLYKGKLLKADKLIYDKSKKIISASGNITLVFGEQIFKMSELEYNLKDKTGKKLN